MATAAVPMHGHGSEPDEERRQQSTSPGHGRSMPWRSTDREILRKKRGGVGSAEADTCGKRWTERGQVSSSLFGRCSFLS